MWLDGEMTDSFDSVTRRLMEAITANWDARAPIHAASRFYGVGVKDPAFWFADVEWEDLGELTGRDLLHAQCHLGTETIAFAQRGARVVGLDISEQAIVWARRIADQAGVDIEYVQANIYDAVTALQGRQFDIIYTGKGALCYLPDLKRWATVLAQLLRPAGRVYLVEFHPVLTALGVGPSEDLNEGLALRHDYLEGRGPRALNSPRTYTDGPPLPTTTITYEWAHGLGEVVTALLSAGLRITVLREIDALPWPRWPWMLPTDAGWWRLPDDRPKLPLLYAVAAVKDND